MNKRFEELDHRQTLMGEISLRRRREPTLQVDVYEARLDEEFLMSSLFTVAEVGLATLGLAAVQGSELDVVVGGLGLGYTAHAVLAEPRVRSLHVVEALGEVVGWHRNELLPVSADLNKDPRCHLVQQDFFAAVLGDGFGPGVPERLHAILVDIDHTPGHVLDPSHSPFYSVEGMTRLTHLLHPGGVFGLWSDGPDVRVLEVLEKVFATAEEQVITFPNHYTGGQSANAVYICTVPG